MTRIIFLYQNKYRRIFYGLSAFILLITSAGSVYATPSFTNYPISSSYRNPSQTTVAGSTLWYLESTSSNPTTINQIGRMSTSGTTTDYDIPTLSGISGLFLLSLTTGSDGNVWFNGVVGSYGYTGRLNITTGTVSAYPNLIQGYSYPGNLITGSDGNLWYYIKTSSAPSYTYLVAMNPSTLVSTTKHSFDTYADIESLATGPDGNIWVYDTYSNRISNWTTSGSPVGSYLLSTGKYGYYLSAGPDGNVWFMSSSNSISKITPTGTITNYLLSSGGTPALITAGADGAMWFADMSSSGKKIGRITTTGTITEYAVPTGITDLRGMGAGPDGAIWFTSSYNNGTIVKVPTDPTYTTYSISSSYRNPSQMTVAGGALWYLASNSSSPTTINQIGRTSVSGTTTNYDIPTLTGITGLFLLSLTTGSDGNIWFNGIVGNQGYTGYLNISTGVASAYSNPIQGYSSPGNLINGPDGNIWYYIKTSSSPSYTYLVAINPSTLITTTKHTFSDTYADLEGIANGPDNNVWVYDAYYNRISNWTSSGSPVGSYLLSTGSYAYYLTAGADGNMWFLSGSGTIGKITPSGTVTNYSLPSGAQSGLMTGGVDGAMWFIDMSSSGKKIGRITSSGTVTEYAVPSGITDLRGIVNGPDGAIWFTSSSNNGTVGRLGY